MKKEWLLLIILIIFSTSSPAEAANWKWVSETTNDIVYVDLESISLLGPNGPKEIWIKFLQKSPDCTSDVPKNFNKCMKDLNSYQRFLSNKSVCIMQQVIYFTDNTQENTKFSCDVYRIVPGSTNEAIWKYLFNQH